MVSGLGRVRGGLWYLFSVFFIYLYDFLVFIVFYLYRNCSSILVFKVVIFVLILVLFVKGYLVV